MPSAWGVHAASTPCCSPLAGGYQQTQSKPNRPLGQLGNETSLSDAGVMSDVTRTGRVPCPGCSKKVSPRAVHCPNCGRTLTPVEALPRATKQVARPREPGELLGSVSFMVAGLAVLLFLVSGFAPTAVQLTLGIISIFMVAVSLGLSLAALSHLRDRPSGDRWHAIAGVALAGFAALLWLISTAALAIGSSDSGKGWEAVTYAVSMLVAAILVYPTYQGAAPRD